MDPQLLEPGVGVILDTETTDLDGRIIEISIIDAATGTVLMDQLINPTLLDIPPGAEWAIRRPHTVLLPVRVRLGATNQSTTHHTAHGERTTPRHEGVQRHHCRKHKESPGFGPHKAGQPTGGRGSRSKVLAPFFLRKVYHVRGHVSKEDIWGKNCHGCWLTRKQVDFTGGGRGWWRSSTSPTGPCPRGRPTS
ncbi:hypothetical protein HMPREF9343_02650 [Cutibacterium acnes HL099PA1]|nr:hypothetical protein HMPREF9594_00564 [Cutibacterium acnes HL005PA1]EGF73213.1 hypothetical protein HMPREF9343_02650 [Cutibacterium acnes HL099PA1]